MPACHARSPFRSVIGPRHHPHRHAALLDGALDRVLWRVCSNLLDELDGDDLRQEPLEARKAKLEKVLARAPAGIQFNEHIDCDGATVYEAACKMGLEGIVSKRRDFPYRSGRSKGWVKVKNPASPAMLRVGGAW